MIDGGPAGRAQRECEALCTSCISMVTTFFAHGPTVLTNQVRYGIKGHFLKILFVVCSITNDRSHMRTTTISFAEFPYAATIRGWLFRRAPMHTHVIRTGTI